VPVDRAGHDGERRAADAQRVVGDGLGMAGFVGLDALDAVLDSLICFLAFDEPRRCADAEPTRIRSEPSNACPIVDDDPL
jgi:hypothetical protein